MERSSPSFSDEYLAEAIRQLEEQRGRPLTDEERARMGELKNRLAQTTGEAVLARRREAEANDAA